LEKAQRQDAEREKHQKEKRMWIPFDIFSFRHIFLSPFGVSGQILKR
jgi:hypothetical protein